jgi:glycosyltransferase involved in cell wall biosynthesis
MRIGIDAREVCGRPTGVGKYLAGLLREWSADERARQHEFVLYAPEAIAVSLDSRRFPARMIAGSRGVWWEQMRLPVAAARDHLDVFFAPAYTSPLRMSTPIVLTIHDISYEAHPEWFHLREGVRRRLVTRASARRARIVIAVSEFSKREIVERLGIDEGRIHVVPQGIDPPALSARTTTEPRILYVGSIFNRRHVVDLIRAVGVLSRTRSEVSLDIVGDNRTFPREHIEQAIDAHGLRPRVRWHHYVDDETLRELYGGARAFAFLSEYEGLGMTPLEALAVGVPPVVLDTPVARETLGDAAVYAPLNTDIPAVARALETALFDERERARVLGAAPAALAKYHWPRAAKNTLALLERAGSDEGGGHR